MPDFVRTTQAYLKDKEKLRVLKKLKDDEKEACDITKLKPKQSDRGFNETMNRTSDSQLSFISA